MAPRTSSDAKPSDGERKSGTRRTRRNGGNSFNKYAHSVFHEEAETQCEQLTKNLPADAKNKPRVMRLTKEATTVLGDASTEILNQIVTVSAGLRPAGAKGSLSTTTAKLALASIFTDNEYLHEMFAFADKAVQRSEDAEAQREFVDKPAKKMRAGA